MYHYFVQFEYIKVDPIDVFHGGMKPRVLPLDPGEKRKHEPRLDQAFSEPARPAARGNPPAPDDDSKTQICSEGPTVRPPHAPMTHSALFSADQQLHTRPSQEHCAPRRRRHNDGLFPPDSVEKYQRWKKHLFFGLLFDW